MLFQQECYFSKDVFVSRNAVSAEKLFQQECYFSRNAISAGM
jgi:hypothetical protein